MIDLSNISLTDLEAMVAAERERRKAAAVAQLEEIAASYGFTLDQLFGATRNRPASREGRRVYGVRAAQIEAALRAGEGVEAIAKSLGWRNSGAVYSYARKLGIPMSNGSAVLS